MSDTVPLRRISGSCHCGNIRLWFERPAEPTAIAVRACGCTFCRKHQGLWTSHPGGSFTLDIAEAARVTDYRFGTRSATFHVCAQCGVVPIVTCNIDSRRYAVLNANAFSDVDRSEFVVAAADFEAESIEERLARRLRNWTPEATGP